jgi:regulator of protease activity HflC (stomatin/prohibitin superfamily)
LLNIGFFKAQPAEYVIRYASGKVVREGAGLTFFYFRHNTQVALIPTSTSDVGFIFNEVTSDFQDLTIQGQYTFRIQDPRQAASLLNFALDLWRRQYLSEEPQRLSQRITNALQTETREEIHKRTLEEALRDYQGIAAEVLGRIRGGGALEPMGVELMAVHFLAAKPTPEVAKALEADYREALLRRADEAVYARRAAAVEEERKIKENELNTDIALEQGRQQLVELEGTNLQSQADHRGKALEREAASRARAAELESAARIRAMEQEAAAYGDLDATRIAALALREMSTNAERILEALGSVKLGRTPGSAE